MSNSTLQPSNTILQPDTVTQQTCKNNEDDNKSVDDTRIEIVYKDNTGKYIYFIFHIIMSFIAIFMTWKCNNGKFDILSFLIALFFPYIYIIYILATRGTCDKL